MKYIVVVVMLITSQFASAYEDIRRGLHININKARIELANRFALAEQGQPCIEQDAEAQIIDLLNSSVRNLLLHLKQEKLIDVKAKHGDILKNYPALNSVMKNNLNYRILLTHAMNQASDDLTGFTAAFAGSTLYNQELVGRESKQKKYEFLSKGRVIFTDENGLAQEGKWKIVQRRVMPIHKGVEIELNGQVKFFIITSVKGPLNYKTGSQIGMAVQTNDDSNDPVLDKSEIYMSYTFKCMAWAG